MREQSVDAVFQGSLLFGLFASFWACVALICTIVTFRLFGKLRQAAIIGPERQTTASLHGVTFAFLAGCLVSLISAAELRARVAGYVDESADRAQKIHYYVSGDGGYLQMESMLWASAAALAVGVLCMFICRKDI